MSFHPQETDKNVTGILRSLYPILNSPWLRSGMAPGPHQSVRQMYRIGGDVIADWFTTDITLPDTETVNTARTA